MTDRTRGEPRPGDANGAMPHTVGNVTAEEVRDPTGLFGLGTSSIVGRPPRILLETMIWQARASLDMIARACAATPVVDEGMVCYALDGADHLLELTERLLEHDVVDAFDENDPRAIPTARLARLVEDARSAAAGVAVIGYGADLDGLARCADAVAGPLRTADRLLNDAIEILEFVRDEPLPDVMPDAAAA